MGESGKIGLSGLAVGYEFAPTTFQVDRPTLATYLKAVEDGSHLFQGGGLVPPLAVGARAMAAMAEGMEVPPGTLHVSQEFEFKSAVSTGQTLVSHARVSRNQTRGPLHLVAIDISVVDGNGRVVLSGKTSFVLPKSGTP